MPRGFVAIGVAVLLGGCGVVTFGPLEVGGAPDGGEPMDAEEPIDMGFPDIGFPDIGPPPDGGDCMYVAAPAYPAAFGSASWPFLERTDAERKARYQTVFYAEASNTLPDGTIAGCNRPTCHGFGDDMAQGSSLPMVPTPELFMADTTVQVPVTTLWERIKISDDATKTGPMYAHDPTSPSVVTNATAEEEWDPADTLLGAPKIDFVNRVIASAEKCHTFGWFKMYETQLCAAGGGGDAGDAGSCVCRAPFETAMAGIDMSWAMMNCKDPTNP